MLNCIEIAVKKLGSSYTKWCTYILLSSLANSCILNDLKRLDMASMIEKYHRYCHYHRHHHFHCYHKWHLQKIYKLI